MPARRSNGSVPPEFARGIMAELARLHGRPDRDTWRDVSSAVCDGIGAGPGIELLQEFWPEEENREYEKLVKSFQWLAPWGSLNKFLKGSSMKAGDWFDGVMVMPDLGPLEGQAKPARKRLADFLVDHSNTLGMSWWEIDALRPPFVIDEFVRRGEVLLLGAESKSRKSWLAQDAGFAVASGLPWLADESGANGFATAQAQVHVFDLELSSSEMRYRFAKARANRFADSPEVAAAMTASVAAYSFDGQNVKEILQRLEELKPTVQPGDLVIVDCLYRLCPDGNEVTPLAEILETVKRFASETQAGVIVVDHFRKAGDEKARNRFAGSFVKQASASTLVAIEVTAEDVLVLNIDARTFYGCPRVHARWNPETHAFNRLPPHGLLPAIDGSWVYVIRRFDRADRDQRLHVEDFAQLSGATRDTKYAGSLEQIAKLVETHSSFPAVEKAALARRLLFCFLIGNEDMHLKNFSLLVEGGKVRLAPAYDLLNSTLVLENASEESALPLRGCKRKLTQGDWIDYFCRERLGLPDAILAGILADLRDGLPKWTEIIRRSFLSGLRQERYLEILEERHHRLFSAS